MNRQNGSVEQMPAWLQARYIALAAELERTHGATFAVAFLSDSGIAPSVGTFKTSWHQPIVNLETIG
jgi:hypothetical protein